MTRQDFSTILRQRRDSSGVTLKDLCYALDSLQYTVYRIEKGSNSYGVDKAIAYASATNSKIGLTTPDGIKHVLKTVDDAISVLKEARGETSYYQVAKDTGYSTTALSRTEKGQTALSIDMLLKLADYFGITVTVE